MKRFITILSVALYASFAMAGNNLYTIDDASIEAKFNAAKEVSFNEYTNINLADKHMGKANMAAFGGEKSAWTAAILAWAVGCLGVHRIYLGTNAGVIVGYILTAGGCGILTVIDFYVLLVAAIQDKGISKYVGCQKFFMWAC